jgi:hypothetical protein
MKGISLPVETIIVIVIAVLVFFTVVGFFFHYWGSSEERAAAQNALNTACLSWKNSNCANWSVQIEGYSVQGRTGTIEDACRTLGYDLAACRRSCGC